MFLYTNNLGKRKYTFGALLVLAGGLLISLLGAAPLYAAKEMRHYMGTKLLFDENYEPTEKLLQLLELLGMGPLQTKEKPIVQINHWAQQNLLRQGERWETQTNRFETLKPKIKTLMRDLGFVDAALPHFKQYQGALVHGALLSTVRLRLHYLVEQWKQGVRFPRLYFLSGERPLEAELEDRNALTDDSNSPLKIRKDWIIPAELPKTECEMTQWIWAQADIPNDMRRTVEVYFIDAPMKKDPKSEKWLRPTTDDTVEYWLKASPPCGSYLAVSNAPYIHRQGLIMCTLAPKGYSFDTIGSSAKEQEKIAVFLDELARFIFQTTKQVR